MGRKKRRTRKLNGAGSITKLSGNRSKPWIVRGPAEIQIDGTVKRPIIGYYGTSEDAEIALSMYKVKPYNIDEKNTTLGDLFDIWIEKKKLDITKDSVREYQNIYKNYLLIFNNRAVRDLKYSHLQPVLFDAPKTMSIRIKSILKGLYTVALKNNIVDKDISTLLETNKIANYKKETSIYNNELVKKIWIFSKNTENMRLKMTAHMVLILLYSGMRAIEIRLLENENILLEKNYMIGGRKTEAGKDRIIPIHSKIKPLIKLYFNQENKYLFMSSKKTPYSDVTFKRNFYKLRNLLNFSNNRHDTRHTFITKLKQLGISDGKLKKIVGHETDDITDGVYTHYEPKDLLMEVEKIDFGC